MVALNGSLRLRKLWAGVTNPAARRALKFGVGATIEHEAAFRRLNFDTIIDIGANKGQFATFARMTFPRARIISFEPLERPAAVYAAVFQHDPLARIVRAAICSKRGQAVMHVTREDDSSSLLDIGAAQAAAFGTAVIEQREVPCGRLSDFVAADEFGSRNLLKIDTQGSELEVLKGVDDFNAFQAVYCEVSFIPLYIGQALASEIVTCLSAHGFGLAGVFNIETARDYGQIQADMLFIRTP